MSRFLRTTAALLLPLAFAACHKPTVEDRAKRAADFVQASKLPEAIVEYQAALQLDPRRGDLRRQLAELSFRLGQIRVAVTESVKAADLLPQDIEAQLQAGNMLLFARSFGEAKFRAGQALALDPRNVDALVLMGNALAGMRDLDGALAEFQEAAALNPTEAATYQSIGAIQGIQGLGVEAEASFRKAVELAPQSIRAKRGLASFLWASRRTQEAEQVLKDALKIDPEDLPVNRALATFYLVSGRLKEAEPHLQTIARVAKTPASMLIVADYYALQRRYDAAETVLKELVAKSEAFSGATTRLAAIDAHNNRRSAAFLKLQDVNARFPEYMPARLLAAQLLLQDGKRDEAAAQANAIVKGEPPTSAMAGAAYEIIGAIHSAADRPEDAIDAYTEALRRRSHSLSANLALAQLYLQVESSDRADTHVKLALGISPDYPFARALEVRVLMARGDKASAMTKFAALQKSFPSSAIVMKLAGDLQMAEGQVAAARSSFLAALAVNPVDTEALAGIARVDLAAGRTKDALERVEAGLKTAGQSAEFLVVAARTYGAAGQVARAEELLKQAIELAPSRLEAYGLLGQVYAAQRRLQDATAQFQQIVSRNPRSISANTMLGMLLEAQGRLPEAEKQYQHTLSLEPTAPVAANNLAWILVSANRDLSQALQLAQAAQQRAPDDRHFNDTLGWIYYRKGMFPAAVPYLERSVRADADSPTTHYHLGMAYYLVADMPKAKAELKRALSFGRDFEGAAEGRRTLGIIVARGY